MWVTFRLRDSDKIRKFQIASTDMSTSRTTSEGIWDRIDPLKEPKRKLVGFAILREGENGIPSWATFNGEGADFRKYPPAHPLLFPADRTKLPIGTRVELLFPEEQ